MPAGLTLKSIEPLPVAPQLVLLITVVLAVGAAELLATVTLVVVLHKVAGLVTVTV